MCSRNADYYEKISDPLDLSTIEKQILIGYYKTVEAFDADMLKVFRNAEVGTAHGLQTQLREWDRKGTVPGLSGFSLYSVNLRISG